MKTNQTKRLVIWLYLAFTMLLPSLVFGSQTNIALGKTVTASTNSQVGKPSLIVDGLSDSVWYSYQGSPTVQDFILDLGELYTIEKVDMYVAQIYGVLVSTSTDGSTYTERYKKDGSSYSGTLSFSGSGYQARYIKYHAYANWPQYVGLSEIEVWSGDSGQSVDGINPPSGISTVEANNNPNTAPVYMGNIVKNGGVATLSGNMELSVNFPAYNKPVDIWILISLPDGRFYTANESGKCSLYSSGSLAAIASGVSGTKTEKKILTPFAIGAANTAFDPWPVDGTWAAYWLVAPDSNGDIFQAIDNGDYQLGFYSFVVNSSNNPDDPSDPNQNTKVVPDVSGKTKSDAISTITAAGFIQGTITEIFDLNVPKGSVVSQSPKAGEDAVTGSKVNLVISKGAIPVSSSFSIIDYFPQSGPAGSYVFLKLGKNISDITSKITVLYDYKELAENTVIQTGEDILQITIPKDAESGDIQIKAGSETSNTVQFTLLASVTTPLVSKSVSPSSTDQVISYNNEIFITIPPGILDTTRTLTISKVENGPANSIDPFAETFAFDVSIDGLEQLNDYIEIKVKYNPELLNSEYSADNQFIPMRWDEKENFWLPLPYQVDTTNKTLSFYTNHLTLIEWIVIGGVAVATIPVTWAGEKLLNDVYVTPEGNFRLLYSKSAIQADATLEDTAWVRTTYKSPLYPISSYQTVYPKFIQDFGHLLETALKNYVDVYKFKDPITKPGWLWGTSKNPITVKIDSWWVALGGNPNYEKVWENIHFPTEVLKDFKKFDSYATSGHELFHRLQAEYYGIVGFKTPDNLWWIEAAAEYAGNRAAWPNKKFDNLHSKTGYDFLSYPISTTGKIANGNGWNLDQSYEYAASAFIQFLVEKKGLNFKDMINHVAGGSPLYAPLEKLSGYNSITLASCYRDFAAWGIFASDSFLQKHAISNISEKHDTLSLGDTGDEETAKIKISFTGGNYSTINIYKSDKEYERTSAIPTPERTISKGDTHELDVKMGNYLYLMASNSGKDDETLYVTISTIKNGEEKQGAIHTFELKGGYSAKLWTVSMACRYQEVAGTNGTVMKDTQTELQWQRCSYGQTWNNTSKTCDGTATKFSPNDAFDLTMDGGWRTPNVQELGTLVYCSDDTFPVNKSWFWTSSWWSFCVGEQCDYIPYAMSYDEGAKTAAVTNLLPVRLVKSPY
ncbi:MAG: PASTA domain-containing protein [Desulfamplus sp.]|nr:PASTA domain-containing protein [Desulfamplus sp.]